MPDTCIFCGHHGPNRDFPPEHWIPDWLNRRLFPEYGSGVRHNLPGRSWEADAFELTVPHVCFRCNRGWMSDIEAASADYVFPLVVGNAGADTINQEALLIVARWCYFKTICLELGRAARPRSHPRSPGVCRVQEDEASALPELLAGVRRPRYRRARAGLRVVREPRRNSVLERPTVARDSGGVSHDPAHRSRGNRRLRNPSAHARERRSRGRLQRPLVGGGMRRIRSGSGLGAGRTTRPIARWCSRRLRRSGAAAVRWWRRSVRSAAAL